ncbi:fungal-specific transcription factor domain-containing protein [Mycena epipterygia]|nr:fungal-specific transcription factor domain-containing protein [Mycena epipterygia]
MFSGGEAFPDSGSQSRIKQRRPQRSCDFCRQRKTRCDGPNMPDGHCSNCLAFGSACTYLQPTGKRGPKSRLVEELKQKNAMLEAKLRSLSICSLCSRPLQSRTHGDGPFTNDSVFHGTPESNDAPTDVKHSLAEDTEDFSHIELADRFRGLVVDPEENKFFGPASAFALVNNAIAEKEKYLGRPEGPSHSRRRPIFWETLPWEKKAYGFQPHYVYPASDLIASLLNLYFNNVHPTLPLLHRPSFERSVAEGLHLRDAQFGAALLAVLGVASRYSDDPRVFVDGDSSLSAGWKFVNQAQVVRKFFDPRLMTLFSLGTSTPQGAWLYLGLGIRFLQHRGEHRRKREDHKFSPDDELWKRAFWCFLSLDRIVCTFLGRPSGIHIEEYEFLSASMDFFLTVVSYDVELPLEIDDEYWGSTQPLGKPSLLSFFVCHLRLCEMLGDVLRRLYASTKSKTLMGWTGVEWDQRVVSELDSAMNDFLDSVPPHLRWDPERTSDAFFDQSASLNVTYNYVQIAIHRPYLRKTNVLAAPSLSICTTAARSIIHAVDTWRRKSKRLPPPFLQSPVFISGVILLMNIFISKRARLSIDKNKDLAQIGTAVEILGSGESRWQTAGRLKEMLQELQFSDGPLSLRWPPKNEPSGSKVGFAEPIMASRETLPVVVESAGMPENGFHPNRTRSFDSEHTWSSMPSSDQSSPLNNDPKAEISIEQLLAETEEFSRPAENGWSNPSVAIDDELMSMWMAVPTDFMNIDQWDAYMRDINAPTGLDAPQQ